jgi:hypothetical protein
LCQDWAMKSLFVSILCSILMCSCLCLWPCRPRFDSLRSCCRRCFLSLSLSQVFRVDYFCFCNWETIRYQYWLYIPFIIRL